MIDNLGNKFIDKLDYQIDKNNSLGAINSDDLLVHITEVNETEENENKISIYSGNHDIIGVKQNDKNFLEEDSIDLTKMRRLTESEIGGSSIKSDKRKSNLINSRFNQINDKSNTKLRESKKEEDISSNCKTENLKRKKKCHSNCFTDSKIVINKVSLTPKPSIESLSEKTKFSMNCESVKSPKSTPSLRKIDNLTKNPSEFKNNVLKICETKSIDMLNSETPEKKQDIETIIKKEDLIEFIEFNEKLKGLFHEEISIDDKINLFKKCKDDKNLQFLIGLNYKNNSISKSVNQIIEPDVKLGIIQDNLDLIENDISNKNVVIYKKNRIENKKKIKIQKNVETRQGRNDFISPYTNQLINSSGATKSLSISPCKDKFNKAYNDKISQERSFSDINQIYLDTKNDDKNVSPLLTNQGNKEGYFENMIDLKNKSYFSRNTSPFKNNLNEYSTVFSQRGSVERGLNIIDPNNNIINKLLHDHRIKKVLNNNEKQPCISFSGKDVLTEESSTNVYKRAGKNSCSTFCNEVVLTKATTYQNTNDTEIEKFSKDFIFESQSSLKSNHACKTQLKVENDRYILSPKIIDNYESLVEKYRNLKLGPSKLEEKNLHSTGNDLKHIVRKNFKCNDNLEYFGNFLKKNRDNSQKISSPLKKFTGKL